MLLRGWGRVTSRSSTTTKPIMDSETQFVNLDALREKEEALYDKVAQRLIDGLSREPKKKYGIERLKALGATEFTGTSMP